MGVWHAGPPSLAAYRLEFDLADRLLDCFATEGGLPIYAAGPGSPLPGAVSSGSPFGGYPADCGFTGAAGQLVLLPGPSGLGGALVGLGQAPDPYLFGALPAALPPGVWHLSDGVPDLAAAVLGWALGAYRYTALKRTRAGPSPRLVVPDGMAPTLSTCRATWLGRDLINMPANLLGPAELAAFAVETLHGCGAHANVIRGEEVATGFPALHAVGAGSPRAPCVVRASWRAPGTPDNAPLISICGKGVCFDTGGYDIKPPAGMLRMKKDMGGAAVALGVARMVVEAALPVRLELRLGCVENMVSGTAMRPGDVLRTRAGLAVEVGNTDAEGRLVLCDLLSEACEAQPDLLLDFATLTGAARVALGPDLPAMFTNDDGLASLFSESGNATHDPVWRLPLWNGYNSWLESGTGDLNNVSEKVQAGAIVAALFLQRFVSVGTKWAHFDVYGWNDAERPGRPAGGEVQAMRAAFEGIAQFASRYGKR